MYDNVIVIGIAISLIYAELTGLSPSGIIVPAYIALNLDNPEKILYTFFIVILTLIIVKFLSRFTIIYGRRRFSIMIILAFILNYIIYKTGLIPSNPGMIGNIIPGIIANHWEKQGILNSLLSLIIVVLIIALIMMLFSIPVFR